MPQKAARPGAFVAALAFDNVLLKNDFLCFVRHCRESTVLCTGFN